MIKVTIKVEGLKELDEKLGKIDHKMRGKALDKAISHGLRPMHAKAKKYAALAKEPHTMQYGKGEVTVQPGLLKSAIRRRKLNKKELSQHKYSTATAIYIGKGTKQKLYPRYWHFIEYGTRKQAAQPFIRPAYDAHKDEAVQRFKSKLSEEISKIIKST